MSVRGQEPFGVRRGSHTLKGPRRALNGRWQKGTSPKGHVLVFRHGCDDGIDGFEGLRGGVEREVVV